MNEMNFLPGIERTHFYFQHQKHVKSKRLLRSINVYAQRWLPARVTSHLTSWEGRVRSRSKSSCKTLWIEGWHHPSFCSSAFFELGLEKWTSSKDWKKTTRQVQIHMPCGLISVLVLVNIFFFPSAHLKGVCFQLKILMPVELSTKTPKKDFKTDDIEFSMYFYCVGVRKPSKLCRGWGWRLWRRIFCFNSGVRVFRTPHTLSEHDQHMIELVDLQHEPLR